MKKYILILFLALMTPFMLKANDEVIQKLRQDLLKSGKIDNYQLGYKYIVAIPPNESSSYGWSDSAIEIYIAAKTYTNIELSIFGSKGVAIIRPNDVFVVDETMGLTKTSAEIRDPNRALDNTVIIKADSPVSVYVLNSKSATSDGYMAIPVDFWGKEYLHCSYYDNFESKTSPFAGGFLVLGSVDQTNVEVELRGYGSNAIATLNGKPESIGSKLSFRLDEGEVYQVESDGLTRGEFDLTGSKITANNPIGVISYHQRTVIPIFASSSRDHLCEMIPPVKNLGTEFASIALEREGSKKGDLFRLVAVEDFTTYNIKWYDFETKELLNSVAGTLDKAGDFQEVSSILTTSANAKSITGTSVFQSDKPILLMQYSYSAGWDQTSFDPFMFVVPPISHYSNSTIIQAPLDKSYTDNYMNLIAIHDSTDINKEDLKSLKIDSTYIVDKVPSFTENRIPGTQLYWARFPISNGAHKLEGNGIEFSGYIYGFQSINSYGWPATMSFKDKNKIDTLPPIITITKDSNNVTRWNIRVQDNRYDESGEVIYEDTQVWDSPLTLLDSTYGYNSYNFYDPFPDFFWQQIPHSDYIVDIDLVDPEKPAKAYFYVFDYAGNIAIDSLSYEPNKIVLQNSQDIDFGDVYVDSTLTKTLIFKNESNKTTSIEDIRLTNEDNFTIVTTNLPTTLGIDATFAIDVMFAPHAEGKEGDTIRIRTDVLDFDYALTGNGIVPEEKLVFGGTDSLDFGTVYVNDSKEMEFEISNESNFDVQIQKIEIKNGTIFSTSDEHNATTLPVGEKITVKVKYSPIQVSALDIAYVQVTTLYNLYTYVVIGSADIDESVYEIDPNFVKISPNPIQTDGNIVVNMTQASNLTAKLYGMEGQLITTLFNGMCNQGEKSIKLDASNIASGTYTLVIELGNKKYASQIVIAK